MLVSEKPIHRLAQLEKAMSSKEYNLFVEKHSSSYSLLKVTISFRIIRSVAFKEVFVSFSRKILVEQQIGVKVHMKLCKTAET